MQKRTARGPVAGLLMLACGCMPAGSARDPEEAWMDTAQVEVLEDGCTGQASVKLVDLPSGHFEVMDVESFAPDGTACATPITRLARSDVAVPLEGERR